jgi:osmotically-inducible protein OsmY
MAMRRQLAVLAFTLSLTGALPGCAAYRAYDKCGFSGCSGDPQISAAVRTLLDQDAAMRAPNLIYVQTLDRVVYLSGQVATDLQRETAESTALEAPGVRSVVDTIALEYQGR